MNAYAQEFPEEDFSSVEAAEQWRSVKPFLDQAINNLPPSDRDVLMLRYYENSSFKAISRQTGKSEDSSRKQASRALEKLAKLLRKRGIVAPSALLATGLGAYFGRDLLPLATHQVAQISLHSNLSVGTSSVLHNTTAIMSGYKLTLAVASLIAFIPPWLQWKVNQKERQARREIVQTASHRSGHESPIHLPSLRGNIAPPRSLEELLSAIAAIADLPMALQRQAKSKQLMMSLCKEELHTVLSILQSPSTAELMRDASDRNELWRSLFTRWVRLDSDSATATLEGLEDLSPMYGLVEGWVGINPQATDAYLASLPPSKLQERLMDCRWRTHAEQDPQRAIEMALLLDDLDAQAAAIQTIVEAVSRDGDPSTIMDTIEKLEPGIDQQRWLQVLLQKLSESNPQEAFAKTIQYPEKKLQRNTLPNIMRAWAQTDPEQGLQMLISLPEEIRQDKVFESYGYGLMNIERTRWALHQLESDDEKCALAHGLAQSYWANPHDFLKLTSEQFNDMRTLVEELPPGSTRTRAEWDFAAVWSLKDSEQAIQWVDQHSNLRKDLKEKFTSEYRR